jgi:hypothetical protein
MGREIVYCVDCGINLREDEFDRGRAQEIDNRPYCVKCKPVGIPRMERKSSSGHIPTIKAPARRPSPSDQIQRSNSPLVLGVIIAAVVFLILVIAGTRRSPSRLPSVPERPALPPSDPPPPRREDPPTLVPPKTSGKLDAFLAQIRALIQEDEAFSRKEEILSMLAAAAKEAGNRAAEVENLKADYLKSSTPQ